MRKYLLPSLPLLLAITLIPAAAHAADTITASPSSVELETTAGSNYSGSVKIFDSGDKPYNFTVSADPFWVHGEDYAQSFVLEPGKTDSSKWFSFPQKSYAAKPGETLPIPYQIKVPSNVGPGGYYAVLFAETQPAPGTGIVAKKRVGIIFYMSVKGPLDVRGKVESFRVPWLHLHAPLETSLRMGNSGNVHYDADIEVDVKDLWGNTKAILPSEKTVLPGTIRRILLSWDQAPGFGLFRVDGRVKYNGKTEPLPARYTLMLSSGAFIVIFLVAIGLVVLALTGRKRKGNVVRRR